MKNSLLFFLLFSIDLHAFAFIPDLNLCGGYEASGTLKTENPQLWLVTATITKNYSMHLDTIMGYADEKLKTEKEKHVTLKTVASCQISAIIENQAENPARDFIYNSDDGEPINIKVSGNGSSIETSNYTESMNGKLIGANIWTDNVSGSARQIASIFFCYSDEYKAVGIGTNVKAVGSHKGREFIFGKWQDLSSDWDDYGIACYGGCNLSTHKNCKITKTAKGYHASWKSSENKQIHSFNGTEFISEEITLDVTVSPYKESDKPVVTLEGCQKLAVGETGSVTATAKPLGGSYKFWVEPSDLMTVTANDATATLSGKTPGRGVLMVEYTTPDGKTAQTSAEASCVNIESYNGGQAIPQIAFYDIDGKKKSGIITIPLTAQPTDAAELVTFEPANPGVLTAVGVGSEVTLQAIITGKTTLQATTKCGANTGPAVEVEVVNCDDETIARLEKMEKAAEENLRTAINELLNAIGSPEFQKARNEFLSSFHQMMLKIGLTIISNGKAPTKAINIAAEIADNGAALSEIISSSNPQELSNNVGKQAAGKSFENIVEKRYTKAVSDAYGKSLSAAIALDEVSNAAQKVCDNASEWALSSQMIEALKKKVEKANSEYDFVKSRQKLCARKKGNTNNQEIPLADLKPIPQEQAPKQNPTPKTEHPPVQEPQNDQPTTEQPTHDDEILIDPEQPPIPSTKVGLPYEPGDCSCNNTKNITATAKDFSTLGAGMKNLGECVENFKSISLTDYQGALQELSTLTGSMSNLLKTDAAAFLVKAKESKPQLDDLVNRIKTYDEAGNAFLKTMEKCPESLNIGMEIFQSVEKITVDSINTHY